MVEVEDTLRENKQKFERLSVELIDFVSRTTYSDHLFFCIFLFFAIFA
jgi:hypothetical protein